MSGALQSKAGPFFASSVNEEADRPSGLFDTTPMQLGALLFRFPFEDFLVDQGRRLCMGPQ